MTLGEWIPEYLKCYKLNTVRPDSYYILELAARQIPQELKDMELSAILPMHLQKFYNDFAQTASKSYMDKVRVLVKDLFATSAIFAKIRGNTADVTPKIIQARSFSKLGC